MIVRPRVAIPMPHSGDPDYAQRAIPQYERAVAAAGGEPVRIPLNQALDATMKLIESCNVVLLPGSKADVDPAKYGAPRHPKTEDADAKRDTVDELLLQDAYNMRKPILGICYGLQILNVYRGGTLVQDIESRINASPVNHAAGRHVPVAHSVEIDSTSRLGEIVRKSRPGAPANDKVLQVNSSHHQAADSVGDGLRVVARCPEDEIIEAVEGLNPDHFVLAVQWHPERSAEVDGTSRALFAALVNAAGIKMTSQLL